MKNFKPADWIFSGMIAVGAVGKTLLPAMGPAVLVNEICGCMMFLGAALFLIRFALKAHKVKENKVMLVAVVLAAFSGLVAASNAINVAADMGAGTTTITLSNCEVQSDSSIRGILFQDYYLTGVDSQGFKHKFVISRDAYYDFGNSRSVTVECYENSGRIVALK